MSSSPDRLASGGDDTVDRKVSERSSGCVCPVSISSITSIRTSFALPPSTLERVVSETKSMLSTHLGPEFGSFPPGATTLESYEASPLAYSNFKVRRRLYKKVGEFAPFIRAYDAIVLEEVIPRIKDELGLPDRTEYHYQCPPTVRLQPSGTGPGKVHKDEIYGHQVGEVNAWVQLTG